MNLYDMLIAKSVTGSGGGGGGGSLDLQELTVTNSTGNTVCVIGLLDANGKISNFALTPGKDATAYMPKFAEPGTGFSSVYTFKCVDPEGMELENVYVYCYFADETIIPSHYEQIQNHDIYYPIDMYHYSEAEQKEVEVYPDGIYIWAQQ